MKREIVFVVATLCLVSGCGRTGEPDTSPLVGDAPPRIDGIDVEVDAAGLAMLTARAIAPAGGDLLYNWGARALHPPVLSESQVVLDGARVDPGTVTAHLVVQGELGAVATAQVSFYRDGACPLCGTRDVRVVETPADEPCVYVHARCIARCRADAPYGPLGASCANECAAGMALCRTNPS